MKKSLFPPSGVQAFTPARPWDYHCPYPVLEIIHHIRRCFFFYNKNAYFFYIFLHFSIINRNFANLNMKKIKLWLQSLSFRTGVIVLLCCILFYILSFAQILLPISVAAKGVLWTILFGLAKTCQYGGLTILGVEGYKRLKAAFKVKSERWKVKREKWKVNKWNTCHKRATTNS